MDKQRFQDALKTAAERSQADKGIGTLKEGTLHSALKYYFEPDEQYHEIKTGRYFADIRYKNEIIEIQTGNFNALRDKLKVLLESSMLTLVYPVAAVKWLCWIDPDTHEVTKKRKSPRRGKIYDAFYELYKIKQMLNNKNLSLCVVLLEIEEYRLLNGWSKDRKKGSWRYERVPVDIIAEVYAGGTDGYGSLMPDGLPSPFTSEDFAKCCGINRSRAQTALNVLNYTGDVERVGKKGNTYLYDKLSSKG